MQVCGTEWVAHVDLHRRKLMDELHAQTAATGGSHPPDARHLPRHGRPPEARDRLERGRAADRRADRVDRRADRRRSRAGARCAARHPSPERIAAQVALGYFLPYPVAPRDRLRARASCCASSESLGWDLVRARAHTRRARDATPAPPGRGPRLPLRGRPVGALPPPPAPGGRAARRAPARATTSSTSRAGTWSASAASTSSASCTRCSTAARAGSDWRRPR